MKKELPLKKIDPYQSERTCLIISLIFVLLLMVWGLVFSELTTSNIIEVDAAAYVISGIISLVTIFVSRLQEKPKSDDYPLGYSGFIPILNLIRNLMNKLIMHISTVKIILQINYYFILQFNFFYK